MNKQELIAAIATETELTQKVVKQVIDSLVTTIVTTIAESSEASVSLSGLGTFSSVDTAERNGRNPSTGEALLIPASRRATFSYAAPAKRAVKETV